MKSECVNSETAVVDIPPVPAEWAQVLLVVCTGRPAVVALSAAAEVYTQEHQEMGTGAVADIHIGMVVAVVPVRVVAVVVAGMQTANGVEVEAFQVAGRYSVVVRNMGIGHMADSAPLSKESAGCC